MTGEPAPRPREQALVEPVDPGPPDLLLVRYGELALKRGNRRKFEEALARNVRKGLEGLTPLKVSREHGRLTVHPERRAREAARRCAEIPGIKTVSPAWSTDHDPARIAGLARGLLHEHLATRPADAPRLTFRVRAKRAYKPFPMTSVELERWIAESILTDDDPLEVRMKGAELELGIEVRDRNTYLFLERLPGPGGLPVGTLGRALCLLSGGIDSPVAAYQCMRRGTSVGFVSFHSPPYLGDSSKRKIADLVRALARFQGESRLYVVPFTECQQAIKDACLPEYRTVLYRRMMQRIAARLARRDGFEALITGESLGQVASQTMENLTCIGAATDLLVLRPLLTYDKEDAIAVAQRIGTFDISIRPEPDCCTVFQPQKPVVRGRLDRCLETETHLDLEGLVERALAGVEARQIGADD